MPTSIRPPVGSPEKVNGGAAATREALHRHPMRCAGLSEFSSGPSPQLPFLQKSHRGSLRDRYPISQAPKQHPPALLDPTSTTNSSLRQALPSFNPLKTLSTFKPPSFHLASKRRSTPPVFLLPSPLLHQLHPGAPSWLCPPPQASPRARNQGQGLSPPSLALSAPPKPSPRPCSNQRRLR